MSLAWHVAALQRAKRLPKLKTLLVKSSGERRRQTWQEQQAVMGLWADRMKKINDTLKARKKKQ